MGFRSNRLIVGLFVLLLTALWVNPIYAQTPPEEPPPPITAAVDVAELTTSDTVTLTVVVTTQTALDPPLPELPVLGNLVVIDQGSSSRIFIQNNRANIEATHTYLLRPTAAGSHTIGPVTVIMDGQVHSTEPIFLNVFQGDPNIVLEPASELPEATLSKLVGQDFFVESYVDKFTPYIGEQVTYTLRFFRAVNIIDQPSYDAPRFSGFWSSDEILQNEYRVQTSGRRYDVLELSTIIFPASSGTLTISPASLTVSRGTQEPDTLLRTTSVGMTVFPHPEGAPVNFDGTAVGNFTISAEVEATSGIVNDPVILTVTISGQGNPNTLPDPVWSEITNWRAFDSSTSVEEQIVGGVFSGTKTYERIMIPNLSGEYTIPPVPFSYFDPATVEYRSISTRPISVSIIPGASGLAPLAVQQIKRSPDVLGPNDAPLIANGIYWIIWIVPVILVSSLLAWRFFSDRAKYDTPDARRRNAHRKARKVLRQLSRNGDDAYVVSGQILTMYISDKLNHTVYGMTYEDVGELLEACGVDSDLIERVKSSLAVSDQGRFAHNAASNGSSLELIDRTRVLISDLEKGIGA